MTNLFKNILFIVSLFSLFFISCRKDVFEKTAQTNSSAVSALTGSDSILKAINPFGIIGEYSTRGSRTVYDGQANENGDNMKLAIDFYGVKKILPSPDKKHLTCPYGEGKYVERGWKYIIGYDFKIKKIMLA